MEQLCASLVPVVNMWRVTLAEELSCIEAGRATVEQKDMYKNHRAFLDCMQAYIQSFSVGESLAAFLESSENIGLTKHMLFRSRPNIAEQERQKCVQALNRAISDKQERTKCVQPLNRAIPDRRQKYVCKRCVLVVEAATKPEVCMRCGCSGVNKAIR